MTDLSTSLNDLALVVGVIAGAAVLLNQVFGTGGLLDTGWSSRTRAVAILRTEYPEFGRMFTAVSGYRPKGALGFIASVGSSFIPLAMSQLQIHFPQTVQLWDLAAVGAVMVGSFIVASGLVTKLAARFESLASKLDEDARKRLGIARFVQGRLVLAWLNMPGILVAASVSALQKSQDTGTSWTVFAALAIAVGGSTWFAFAAMEALMVIEDATFVDFLHSTGTEPKVRLSLRENAGGHHTVTGKLRFLGKECIVVDAEGFTERLMWHQVARLAAAPPPVSTTATQSSASPPEAAASAASSPAVGSN